MTQNLTVRDLQGATLTGRSDRLSQEHLTEGVMVASASGHFQVVQQASPNMTVRVGSGVAGDLYVVPIAGRGVYIVHNRTDTYIGSGNSDVPISNGDPTNPRIDGIDLRVRDNEFDSSGFNDATVIVTQGTPAGSPSAPAIPSGCVRLGTILVPANRSTSIGTGDITDTRKVSTAWSAARGQMVTPAQVTASQSGIAISTETDLTGIALTFTALAGRRYRYWWKGETTPTVADGAFVFNLKTSGGTILDRATGAFLSTASQTVFIMYEEAPGAGARSIKVSINKVSGTGTVAMNASGTSPSTLMVEDVGGF